MKRWSDDLGKWLVIVILAVSVIFLVGPIFISVAMSFDDRAYLGQFPPPDLSLRWYSQFFSDDYFLTGLVTSLQLAILSTLISTAFGVLAALALDRYTFPAKDWLSSLFLSPLIVPQVVMGFALLLFFATWQVSDGFLRLLGGHIIVTIPYTIRATLAGLIGIRRSLVEAALALGANERQAFWDVTFPLARTGIMAGAIFALAFSLDDVAVSLFLADPSSYTLPIALITSMRASFDLTIAAAAVVLISLTAGLMLLLDRLVGLEKVVGQGIYRA